MIKKKKSYRTRSNNNRSEVVKVGTLIGHYWCLIYYVTWMLSGVDDDAHVHIGRPPAGISWWKLDIDAVARSEVEGTKARGTTKRKIVILCPCNWRRRRDDEAGSAAFGRKR
jgi:hypothetical protein